MEKRHSHRTYIPKPPLFIFLLHFLTLHSISSSAYEIPDEYFINCGSKETVNNGSRNFTGDGNSGYSKTGFFFTKHSSAVSSKNQQNISSLYKTARIFQEQSSYVFNFESVSVEGVITIYLVRLHFFAFSSHTDLSTAVFDVSASGFLLLHNFTAQSSKKSPLIKEFFLPTNTSKFQISFTPNQSSFAFVNAIEVFPAPPLNFSLGEAKSTRGILKTAPTTFLQTIYRIDVGATSIVDSDKDPVWRNWETDDSYLYGKDKTFTQTSSVIIRYQSEEMKYAAPQWVYQTARAINGSSNVTWGFVVNKTARHLVRAHFFDFATQAANLLAFNVYINSNISREINYTNYLKDSSIPFYIDLEVGSYDSGVMNVSIGHTTPKYGENPFLNGLEIFEIMDALASMPTATEDHSTKTLVVGSVLGSVALLCILATGFCFFIKCRRPNSIENSIWRHASFGWIISSRRSSTTRHPVPNLNLGLTISFSEIKSATKNFSPKQQIGKGGFGIVYKGTLSDGTQVAVKRSAPGSGQGLSEFQTEIMVLSKIRHQHLVSLIGYCEERSEMILVYEFMEKGSLTDHLCNSDLPRLPWKQRLEICIGAARGLKYLHNDSPQVIIHRDVKSTNILLDQNLVAKVADFGLSKSGPPEESHISTKVKGTFGYLDPEYFKSQQLSEKSDVYSFGVVLLEVLCARPVIDNLLPRDQINLAEWAKHCKNKGVIEEIIDPSLKGQINPNSLNKFIETAEKCLQDEGADRPSMVDVIWDLEYALRYQQTPVPRELHEDSTITHSLAFVMPDVRRLPSLDSTIDIDDDTTTLSENLSELTAGESFPQMRTENSAR
ncbi:probable receptor-like protein kinase At2g23200 [Humulus lupulus]|uniref:probable receptor-like protein kinase At2g23200 n=1 Tax=Humulus lupulus TaxID=3486 RepID=UPI002B415896|nr:probable receptor-like protein kinase At2g23200 [Humulus lupulus]